MYAPESNPATNDVLIRLRGVLTCNVMQRDNAMRTLMVELLKGRSAGFATDNRFDGGEMVPFIGVDAPTNTVPSRHALGFGADLVPGRTERLPGMRFRVTFYDPVVPGDPQVPQEEQILQMSAQLNNRFEDWIRLTPGQWMCMSRRWPGSAEPSRGGSAGAV
jgi:KDO2-lipid IV(A) lauroyltransferase